MLDPRAADAVEALLSDGLAAAQNAFHSSAGRRRNLLTQAPPEHAADAWCLEHRLRWLGPGAVIVVTGRRMRKARA